jgi:hypothetical protein
VDRQGRLDSTGTGADRATRSGRPGRPARPGWTGLEYVTVTVVGTGVVIARALCPAGKHVVSGGGGTNEGFLFSSIATQPEGWNVAAETSVGVTTTVTAQALCAFLPAGAATTAPEPVAALKRVGG